MKVLYAKINSERSRKFQLKTVVYEENHQKFVKKQALHPDAVAHLKKMKESYNKLQNTIVDHRIKLAKIIKEEPDALIFEFIDGISLQKQYSKAKREGKAETQDIIDTYHSLLQNGFKTTIFDSKTMVTDEFKAILGDFDYSTFDGKPCFDGVSNIDLIFSNIIYRDNDIYLIDYEWVYDLHIPIAFAAFRALHEDNPLHWKMENHFIFEQVVQSDGFLKIQDNYKHKRMTLKEQEKYIDDLYLALDDKDRHIQTLETNMQKIIYDKDVHIHNQDMKLNQQQNQIIELQQLVQAMRLKNRLKRLVQKSMPTILWEYLKKLKSRQLTSTREENHPCNNYYFAAPVLTERIKQEIENFQHPPFISIIMPVYNVDPKWLQCAIASIEAQWYPHWELCIADDASTNQNTLDYLKNIQNPKIKVDFLTNNLNISGASNAALKLATGSYIALMDNDDELTPDALYEVAKAIQSGAEFIYSDEDKIEMDGTYSDPHFKPDFAPDMFLAQNYLSHLGVIKKSLIDKVGGFTLGVEGAQDYDLYLKVLEHTKKIQHIPKVLYHWRKIPGSTAAEYGEKSYAQEAGRKALEHAMSRRGIQAIVKNGQTPGTYKIDYNLQKHPLVSIIIPFKDKPELLHTSIHSILNKSTYQHFEIIGISNNSTQEQTFQEMKRLEALDERIRFYEYNIPFNYSKINNHAVANYAKGEHILFLNNDIEIITPNWIEELLIYSQQEQNGAIGAKLYFPNDTIQHAGIVMAPKTIHATILMYQGYPKEHYGYISRLRCVNNYSAVTAACLMIKKELFEQIGCFDEEKHSIAYNDIDLCLRLQKHGYYNVWTPYCEAYHHESVSRGYETKVEDVERREKEKWHLKEKYPEIFTHADPYYNINLTRFGVGSELSTAVTKDHAKVEPQPFKEFILLSKQIQEKQQHQTLTIFSHYDAEGTIKPSVLFYLQSLSKFSDILFVSTAEGLSEASLQALQPYCHTIIVKQNTGYDFGAWKTGLNHINTALDTYEALILCNDSVFGPLFDLEHIVTQMSTYDFWSMSDNYEIEYHLQSYFMLYRHQAFTHPTFRQFWDNFKIYEDKQTLIEQYEIGFSQHMMQTDLSYSSYYSVQEKNYVNVLQYYWDHLIQTHHFPFIKKELLLRNPLQLAIDHWEEIIQNYTDYDVNLIKNERKQNDQHR